MRFFKSMDEGKKALIVCVDNKNMHDARDKPDEW
jgi:hypothetical protein